MIQKGTLHEPATSLAIVAQEPLQTLGERAQRAEEIGYAGVWRSEGLGYDAFTVCALWAQRTERLLIATGIASAFSRTPAVLAQAAATLAELSRGRFRLGLGTGAILRASSDRTARSNLDAMGEVIAQIRSLLSGGKVDGVRLEVATPVPLVVAALGPRMLRLAGATADGVLLNWVTPDFVARARVDVDLGARSAGRDPRAIRLAGYVRVAAAPVQMVAEAVTQELAEFAQVPAYERHFGALGIDAAALKAEQLSDLVIAATNREAIHSGFDRFRRAGLDEVVVRPVDGGGSWWDVAELAAPQPA